MTAEGRSTIRGILTATPWLNNAQMMRDVVFDPPYKMNGTPDPDIDARYGVDKYTSWQTRILVIQSGLKECARIARSRILLKCMDQVVSGKKVFQTMIFARDAQQLGFELMDRFDMLRTPRPQPEGRRQVHTLQNYSTLLVLQR